jgi:hypothetical protein
MAISWQHVVLVGLLLASVVISSLYAPGSVSAVAGVVSTIFAYLMKPQIGS